MLYSVVRHIHGFPLLFRVEQVLFIGDNVSVVFVGNPDISD
jgi:hypothetical protein